MKRLLALAAATAFAVTGVMVPIFAADDDAKTTTVACGPCL